MRVLLQIQFEQELVPRDLGGAKNMLFMQHFQLTTYHPSPDGQVCVHWKLHHDKDRAPRVIARSWRATPFSTQA